MLATRVVVMCLVAIVPVATTSGQSDTLRFEEPTYEVVEGVPSVTLRVVYDLDAGTVGDNFFDLSASVDPFPGTGSISILGATRSSPYLYDPALASSGIFNLPAFEFQVVGDLLRANQGANNPLIDMNLGSGTYAYADVTFLISGPIDSVFDITFSNYGLDDADVAPRSLSTLSSTVTIIPEPTSLVLIGSVGALGLFFRRCQAE